MVAASTDAGEVFKIMQATPTDLWTQAIFAGGTGSGKTYSALRFATGLAGGKRFLVIDTERRRASHYAQMPGAPPTPGKFAFDVIDLGPPYTTARYRAAVEAGIAAGYSVIVIDSGSHEWAGEGGMHDQVDDALDVMCERERAMADKYNRDFDETKTREKLNAKAWAKPKVAKKEYRTWLASVAAHTIVCERAEPKIEFATEEKNGRKVTVVRPTQKRGTKDGWAMICDPQDPFEATFSFMFFDEKPGVGIPIKLQEQHRFAFPDGRPITEDSGKAILAWSQGKPTGKHAQAQQPAKQEAPPKDDGTDWAAVIKGINEAASNDELTAIGDALAKRPKGSVPKTVGNAFRDKRNEFNKSATADTNKESK